ncbi:hypothetical protein [Helicobacter sp. 13S00477-4]|uniref:hypothetical protein n=1 Tax=Helicobacter sp. 13S00477-4 TaxID=1905759 RepID=UPI000BC68430|nr:hypothetical protein [Helicobacter sp. 13S00477-4]PAF50857.1 hypothetical protein BKH44_06830 [Helicobacter sp. 13S00477-4]
MCILILSSICFSGCVRVKEVFIPTACQIPKRENPIKTGDLAQDVKNILIYSEGIAKDLEFCRGNEPHMR